MFSRKKNKDAPPRRGSNEVASLRLGLIEKMIIASSSLSFEDKQALLERLPFCTESQISQIQQIFEEEAHENKKIGEQEFTLWQWFKNALSSIQ